MSDDSSPDRCPTCFNQLTFCTCIDPWFNEFVGRAVGTLSPKKVEPQRAIVAFQNGDTYFVNSECPGCPTCERVARLLGWVDEED